MKNIAKKEIRKKMLAIRRSLDDRYVREASHIICERLKSCHLYQTAESICLYMPINHEVDVTELLSADYTLQNKSMDAESGQTRKMYLPKIIDKTMDFYLYEGKDSIALGAFNIPEPTGKKKLMPNEKTLVVMPGVAFSRDGGRLGYGGGYYDTYLEKYPMCRKAAVCFLEQLVEELPVEAHDVKPDIIISNE
ncbi:MAG: 5-formyltetrahydrofolate cyclo-ligase [Clostridium sp.]|nr:5-formyltetrahydrofolate cyclo-ligase [Clostridium sp.]